MKTKNILGLAALGLSLLTSAQADVTINITGATAFRAAASAAIRSAFTSLDYAYSGTTFDSAQYQIFKGSFPEVDGITTIRTNWSGSVEGIRDLSQQNSIGFLPASTTMSSTGTANATTTDLQSATPQLAFSDIYAASTPYDNGSVEGEVAGIIAFRFVATPTANGTLTNITAQQFRNLATNGNTKAHILTGNASHETSVYLTGRNDGSGTRVSVLAETGHGYSQLVQQYKATVTGSGNSTVLTALQLWPTGDGTNVSNIYNTDAVGNGGYQSGSSMVSALAGNSTSVQIKNAAGGNIGSPRTVFLVGCLGTNDSNSAVTRGAIPLSYNGVSLNVNSGGITNPEVITKGSYTLWANEQLYWRSGTNTGDLLTVKDKIVSDIPANLGNAGLDVDTMTVSRSSDGGLVGE
jgi:hypothetical protein